jgi:S-adenosylmethionine:tRNA ribosyltransferase-isomerase
MLLSEYSYDLPPSLVSQSPANPRDSSRLFVYDTKTDKISFSTFAQLADFLPPESLVILNNTKVVPARLHLKKITGGAVEVLLSVNLWNGGEKILGIANKKLKVGDVIGIEPTTPFLTVISDERHEFEFKLEIPPSELFSYLEKYGEAPIPPYIKNTGMSEKEVRESYQTIFNTNPASSAAPTASLHFTEEVFESLRSKDIKTETVTLHVGLGTFAHVTEENLTKNILHTEKYSIPGETAKKILAAKKRHEQVVAVGTTAIRALESAKNHILKGEGVENSMTNIFIRKPYDFSIPDIVITNFHVPRSSLMSLIDAFLFYKGAKRGIVELYEIAIKEKFRFYSFGDAMLIL